MKKPLLLLLISAGLLLIQSAAQAQGLKLPSTITFDYEVVQQNHNGKSGNAETMTYYFTTDGSYAAMTTNTGNTGQAFLIYTPEGNALMVDKQKMTITALNMPGFLMPFGGTASASHSKRKPALTITPGSGKKNIAGYPAVEYVGTDNTNHKISFWYAKVNFDTHAIYSMGQKTDKLNASNTPPNNPLAIAAADKHLLLAEAGDASTKMIETTSIKKTSFTFSTAGYKINNLSGKSLKEILLNGGQ